MNGRPTRKLRCAFYTRKSSEEGLEQQFNSLHAQREAALAYIASQKSQGWIAVSMGPSPSCRLREQISRSHMTRMLRRNLLAPNIVERILDGAAGRREQGTTLEQLERPLPASWEERRQRFS